MSTKDVDNIEFEQDPFAEAEGESRITMTDVETGEDFTFLLADEFIFEEEYYFVLVTEEEDDPQIVFTRVFTLEDGTEGMVSLEQEEFDRVYEAYAEFLEQEIDDEEEDE